MPNRTDKAVQLPVQNYELLRRIAEAEQRSLRMVIERALKQYAARNLPKLLKGGT